MQTGSSTRIAPPLTADDITIADIRARGRCRRQRETVSPRELRDRIRQLLQPGVVGVTAVTLRHRLVQMRFLVFGPPIGQRLPVRRAHTAGRRLEVGLELRRASGFGGTSRTPACSVRSQNRSKSGSPA